MKQNAVSVNSWWYYLIPPALLSLITALAYYPSLHYPFQFDDVANIPKHFHLRHYTFSKLFFINTRWISHWINSIYYHIVQSEPFWYRVGNLFIHCSNGTLLFLILYYSFNRLSQSSFFKRHAFSLALTTSLLFLLHPVQTQTVSYVCQGQLEGLAALLTLLMIGCLLLFAQAKSWIIKGPIVLCMSTVAALICGTKEIAIISPLLLILFDWFLLSEGVWNNFKQRIPLLIAQTTIVWSLYLYLLKPGFFKEIFGLRMEARNNLGNMLTKEYTDTITPYHFCISQFKVILHYLWIFIWPFNMSVEYDWKLVDGFFASDCLVPFLILCTIALTVLLLLYNNKKNIVAFGALWFAIAIAPRSSIIPSCELMVDYKTYLASIGWLLIIAAGLIKIGESIKTSHFGKSQYATVALLIIALGGMTMQRNTVWRSGLEFWWNMIQNAPGKARAYNNYGVELSQALGKYDEAIPYFKQAIMMDKLYRDPYNNLAVSYAALRQFDLAIAILRESLKFYPYYPEAYNNIGSFLLEKDNLDAAQEAFNVAIQLRAHYGKAHFNLGRVYFARGNYQEAWNKFKTACTEADMDNETGFSQFGKLSLMLEKYDDAIFGYERACSFNPTNSEYLFNLANAHFFKQNYQQAERLYKIVLQQDPREMRALFNLAELYLKMDRPQDALTCFERVNLGGGVHAQICIKRAECYARLNNTARAKQLLIEAIASGQLPEQVLQTIQTRLEQIA